MGASFFALRLVMQGIGVLLKDAMPKTQAEILDDHHANFALGGELVPLNPDS